MIIPRFTISQTETLLTIKIHVPYIRVSEAEIFAENNEFTFYCKPFYLKLAFSGEVSSDENCTAKYDPNEENGTITAELPKLIPGTFFSDLDLPTKLLLDRKMADASKYQFPSIEIVSESNNNTSIQNEDLVSEEPITTNLLKHHYGFNQKYCDVLRHQREEILTIFNFSNPDDIPPHQRRAFRLEHEITSFDVERYLGDFLEGSDDPIHIEALAFKPFWEELWTKKKKLSSSSSSSSSSSKSTKEEEFSQEVDTIEEELFGSGFFTDDENETMRRLPKRTYLVSGNEERSILLSLLDILFAYCYDHRTTQGESTVESAYTIAILSPTLSSFENYLHYPIELDDPLSGGEALSSSFSSSISISSSSVAASSQPSSQSSSQPSSQSSSSSNYQTFSVREVMIQSAKRVLIYPYLRTWKLVKKIFVDVTKILLLGQRCILKCLLQIHQIFEKTETYYLMNKLYLDDYCVWLQCVGNTSTISMITELGKEYNNLKSGITKKDMSELKIEEIERSLEEEEQEQEEEEEEESGNKNENRGDSVEEKNEMAEGSVPVSLAVSVPPLHSSSSHSPIKKITPTTTSPPPPSSSSSAARPLIEVISSVHFSEEPTETQLPPPPHQEN